MFRVILERFWITPLPPAEALSAAERGRIPDPSLFRVIQSAAKNPGSFLSSVSFLSEAKNPGFFLAASPALRCCARRPVSEVKSGTVGI
jgi:hypothetical protein